MLDIVGVHHYWESWFFYLTLESLDLPVNCLASESAGRGGLWELVPMIKGTVFLRHKAWDTSACSLPIPQHLNTLSEPPVSNQYHSGCFLLRLGLCLSKSSGNSELFKSSRAPFACNIFLSGILSHKFQKPLHPWTLIPDFSIKRIFWTSLLYGNSLKSTHQRKQEESGTDLICSLLSLNCITWGHSGL